MLTFIAIVALVSVPYLLSVCFDWPEDSPTRPEERTDAQRRHD